MHRDCNYPQAPTNAYNLYKITNHPHLYVSAINHHPQGDINTKEYNINISNSHIQCYK